MCEDSVEVSIAMGHLVSQLSQEPWKGKVINYHEDSPQLELIQGGHDLRGCEKEFEARADGQEEYNKNKPVIPYKGPGLTVLTGFSNKLLKLFLENDGEFGPEHVMEVAISGDEFQSLAVVD
ncbi:hypothetical protein L3X38_009104 [Prunus dulcis]|uniref:DUF7788 domain-containing protein n=1 Tax=Prunus dulcis TaxID=3755 RepID=A0AAD5F7N1_PRUDU|nr:hypothetical protein L3X38_009104 [Prunus dulcis]